MAITYKIWDFPILQVQSQIFYAPGEAFDGGFTSGSAQVTSPEPGGRAFLEIELALQTDEWENPFSSWIMSKTNGDIFKVQLVKTPQVVPAGKLNVSAAGIPWGAETIYPDSKWNNDEFWSSDDIYVPSNGAFYDGQNVISVNVSEFGQVLKHGHVIGAGDYSHIIDDISYSGNIATLTIKPPLRKDVSSGEQIYLRPWFLGRIVNGSEMRATYRKQNEGHIQPSRIVFAEVIL